MNSTPTCFFAYPSHPLLLAETVENAITQINSSKIVFMESWKSTNVSGKFIMQEICKAIDAHDFFACDITCLNPNVLFELGYAIAQKKRIWVSRDTSFDEENNKNYTRLELLTTIGYAPYANYQSLTKEFYKDNPYEDLSSTIYDTVIKSIVKRGEDRSLLYLKSCCDTDSSIRITRRVNKTDIPLIIDDPSEVQTRPFNWYIQSVFSAYGVLAHLIGPHRKGWQLHNAKYALISGIAYGFGKHLLMLAEEPYTSPIDYQDLLQIYKTAKQCNSYVVEWLSNVEFEYKEKRKTFQTYEKIKKDKFELQNISIGDYVAENESDELLEYFVTTSAYIEALNSQQSIFIGRKGTGKTANLYKIVDELSQDSRNHICVIKPVAYELEGVIRMLQQSLPKSEKGYLIETFWKFLIYTELAKTIVDRLREKPVYYQRNEHENELYEFVEGHASLIDNDFSIRLEQAVISLCEIGYEPTAERQRIKISEILHSKIIGKLSDLLWRVFERKNRVAILIDNLDKTWQRREDMTDLCELLFGLLRVTKTIREEFRRKSRRFNFSLTLFLRSDIFNFIIEHAREKDKISYSMLNWNDKDLLIRVIEERFCSLCGELVTPDEIWKKYFCSAVKDKSTKEYILERIIPRPRDIIYICKASIDEAVNRGHGVVEEADILEGEKKYSQYVFDSLLVENGVSVTELEAILYEFVGANEIVLHSEVVDILTKCNVEKDRIDYVIQLLLNLTFLGLEISKDKFVFIYNESDKRKYQVLAQKLIRHEKMKEPRYQINKPFHSFLEVREGQFK